MQIYAFGVTVIVAVTGTRPVLTGIKEAIFPLPLDARPIEGLLFVQVKLVPATGPEKLMIPVGTLLQTMWLAGRTTLGVAYTTNEKVVELPGQIPFMGVTTIVAITGALVVLIAVNDGIFPLPLVGSPIDGSSFVQTKEVPLSEPVNATGCAVDPLHNNWLLGCTTVGDGFTVMVNVCGGPVQPKWVGVTVIVAVTGVAPAFCV